MTAPFVGSDADDTAKTIMAMNLLGKPTMPRALIQAYESKEYFITYPGERTPSFSVNCNVLDTLLHSPNPSDFIVQIEKTAHYLCKRWYELNDPIMDKWVRSTILIRSPHTNLFQHAEYLHWLLNHVDVSVVDEIARDVGQGDSSWT